MAKKKEKVEDKVAAKAKVEEAGNGRKNMYHLFSRLPSTANTVGKGTTQLRTAGRSKRMTRNNKKTGMQNSKQHSKVNLDPKPGAQPFPKPAPKPAPSLKPAPKPAPNPAPVAAPEEEGSNKKKRKLLSMEKYLLKQCEKHRIPLKNLQAAQK